MKTEKQTIKVAVWSDGDGIAAICKADSPKNNLFAGKGLVRLGYVDVKPVGVVWGPASEVSRELRERVQAEVDAGRIHATK